MKTHTITSRGLEILALFLIGEGVVGLLRPTRYARFWNVGPKFHREIVKFFAEHREATRVCAIAEVAFGLWLALHEIEE